MKLDKNVRGIYLEGIVEISKVDEASQEKWRAYSPNIIESENWNNDLVCTVSSVFPKLSQRLLLRDCRRITNQILKSLIWAILNLHEASSTFNNQKLHTKFLFSSKPGRCVDLRSSFPLAPAAAFKWLVSHVWLWPTTWFCSSWSTATMSASVTIRIQTVTMST